jgi:hypothetical protein
MNNKSKTLPVEPERLEVIKAQVVDEFYAKALRKEELEFSSGQVVEIIHEISITKEECKNITMLETEHIMTNKKHIENIFHAVIDRAHKEIGDFHDCKKCPLEYLCEPSQFDSMEEFVKGLGLSKEREAVLIQMLMSQLKHDLRNMN